MIAAWIYVGGLGCGRAVPRKRPARENGCEGRKERRRMWLKSEKALRACNYRASKLGLISSGHVRAVATEDRGTCFEQNPRYAGMIIRRK